MPRSPRTRVRRTFVGETQSTARLNAAPDSSAPLTSTRSSWRRPVRYWVWAASIAMRESESQLTRSMSWVARSLTTPTSCTRDGKGPLRTVETVNSRPIWPPSRRRRSSPGQELLDRGEHERRVVDRPVAVPTRIDGTGEFDPLGALEQAGVVPAHHAQADHRPAVAWRVHWPRTISPAPEALSVSAPVAIPLFDIHAPIAPLRSELLAAAERVLDSGGYILGPEVEAFEAEFADFLGVAHAVGVANGTDAITLALRALGVGPGDEVVVPSFTFYASAEAIPPTGARPVFCDVDPDTMLVSADTVRAALTPRTKAVIAVHLFGNVAPVAEIAALGVPVLGDGAQAAGSRGPEGRPGAPAAAGLGVLVRRPAPTAGERAAWHVYVVRSPQVDEVHRALAAADIASKVYYRPPVHEHPAMAPYAPSDPLPATAELALTHLAIPMSPVLSPEAAAEITATVARSLGQD